MINLLTIMQYENSKKFDQKIFLNNYTYNNEKFHFITRFNPRLYSTRLFTRMTKISDFILSFAG